VLLSGGLDSATTLALARQQGFRCHALSFDYGQRHAVELLAARALAQHFHVARHVIVPIDLRVFGGSALTSDLAVPKDRSPGDMEQGIPVTYVPARNTIFLSLALGWAEVLEAFDIFLGVNALDYSGYPDCRPEYLSAFEALANLATKAGVQGRRFRIHAPLVNMSKAEIIRTGTRLGVEFGMTTSCYDPSSEGLACGRCDACVLRLKGFAENQLVDPRKYQR
jgi:7-cyano-7-deazaguanine synthase